MQKQQLDQEIREMVSVLTRRMTELQNLHKPGSTQHHEDEDEHGMRVITLAGTNTGATMRSELDDKPAHPDGAFKVDENEALTAYVNSNSQAINNSIMLGGSYTSNDPGVHMDVSEFFEQREKPDKQARNMKKKEKEKESYSSDQK